MNSRWADFALLVSLLSSSVLFSAELATYTQVQTREAPKVLPWISCSHIARELISNGHRVVSISQMQLNQISPDGSRLAGTWMGNPGDFLMTDGEFIRQLDPNGDPVPKIEGPLGKQAPGTGLLVDINSSPQAMLVPSNGIVGYGLRGIFEPWMNTYSYSVDSFGNSYLRSQLGFLNMDALKRTELLNRDAEIHADVFSATAKWRILQIDTPPILKSPNHRGDFLFLAFRPNSQELPRLIRLRSKNNGWIQLLGSSDNLEMVVLEAPSRSDDWQTRVYIPSKKVDRPKGDSADFIYPISKIENLKTAAGGKIEGRDVGINTKEVQVHGSGLNSILHSSSGKFFITGTGRLQSSQLDSNLMGIWKLQNGRVEEVIPEGWLEFVDECYELSRIAEPHLGSPYVQLEKVAFSENEKYLVAVVMVEAGLENPFNPRALDDPEFNPNETQHTKRYLRLIRMNLENLEEQPKVVDMEDGDSEIDFSISNDGRIRIVTANLQSLTYYDLDEGRKTEVPFPAELDKFYRVSDPQISRSGNRVVISGESRMPGTEGLNGQYTVIHQGDKTESLVFDLAP